MRILYDYQIFSFQKYGGISRYYVELFSQLKNIVKLPLVYSQNEYIDKKYHRSILIKIKGAKRILKILNKLLLIIYLKFGRYDIYHPTYYSLDFLKYSKRPIVVTVYDMIHEKYPAFFSSMDLLTDSKKKMVETADKIIAISENTKKDLIEIYNINPDKVKVIYLATSINISNNSLSLTNYILFVGSRSIYKNFNTFFEAMIDIMYKYIDVKLICVGGGNFSKAENEMIIKNGLEGRVLQFQVEDNELYLYYKNALAFVFPSIYEGFGLPILEAFACDCPVALSNTSCFPEIAGDAAIYFNPFNKNEIFETINHIIESPDTRKHLIHAGKIRLSMYSWEKTAIETINLYKEAIR